MERLWRKNFQEKRLSCQPNLTLSVCHIMVVNVPILESLCKHQNRPALYVTVCSFSFNFQINFLYKYFCDSKYLNTPSYLENQKNIFKIIFTITFSRFELAFFKTPLILFGFCALGIAGRRQRYFSNKTARFCKLNTH